MHSRLSTKPKSLITEILVYLLFVFFLISFFFLRQGYSLSSPGWALPVFYLPSAGITGVSYQAQFYVLIHIKSHLKSLHYENEINP